MNTVSFNNELSSVRRLVKCEFMNSFYTIEFPLSVTEQAGHMKIVCKAGKHVRFVDSPREDAQRIVDIINEENAQ